jgi:hypothetical protein
METLSTSPGHGPAPQATQEDIRILQAQIANLEAKMSALETMRAIDGTVERKGKQRRKTVHHRLSRSGLLKRAAAGIAGLAAAELGGSMGATPHGTAINNIVPTRLGVTRGEEIPR